MQGRRNWGELESCYSPKFQDRTRGGRTKKFPIISTAYFTNEINKKCKLSGILAIRVVRNNFKKIIKSHKIYKNSSNVVGKNIKFKNLKTYKIINDNSNNFIFKFKLFKDLNFFN